MNGCVSFLDYYVWICVWKSVIFWCRTKMTHSTDNNRLKHSTRTTIFFQFESVLEENQKYHKNHLYMRVLCFSLFGISCLPCTIHFQFVEKSVFLIEQGEIKEVEQTRESAKKPRRNSKCKKMSSRNFITTALLYLCDIVLLSTATDFMRFENWLVASLSTGTKTESKHT